MVFAGVVFRGVVELVDTLDEHGIVQSHCYESPGYWTYIVDPVVVSEVQHDHGGGEGSCGVETAAGEGGHEEDAGQNHESS